MKNYHATYYLKHKERRLAEAKERRKNRTPEEIEKEREYQKAYRAANKARALKARRKYYRENREEELAKAKEKYRELKRLAEIGRQVLEERAKAEGQG